MPDQSFYIRDYCAAMVLDGPSEVFQEFPDFNITRQANPPLDTVQGNWTQPWVYKIEKYLKTEESFFHLQYVNYTKYRPDGSWPAVKNQKCGRLRYDIVYTSYKKNEMFIEEIDDIMYKPEGTGYYD